jgi:molybdopterin synthase sulfur carrier subunit
LGGKKTVDIQIRFFTILRELLGKKTEVLTFQDLHDITVETVLERLTETYGQVFNDYIFDKETNTVKNHLAFLVNGSNVMINHGLQTPLKNGDVLAIIPPVGGG